MSNQWKGKNRHKHLLARKNLADSMKELSRQLCEKHGVLIKYAEADKDHIRLGTSVNVC